VEGCIGRSVRMNLGKIISLSYVLTNILGNIVRRVGRMIRRTVALSHHGVVLAHVFSHIYAMISFFGQIVSLIVSFIFLYQSGLICRDISFECHIMRYVVRSVPLNCSVGSFILLDKLSCILRNIMRRVDFLGMISGLVAGNSNVVRGILNNISLLRSIGLNQVGSVMRNIFRFVG